MLQNIKWSIELVTIDIRCIMNENITPILIKIFNILVTFLYYSVTCRKTRFTSLLVKASQTNFSLYVV